MFAYNQLESLPHMGCPSSFTAWWISFWGSLKLLVERLGIVSDSDCDCLIRLILAWPDISLREIITSNHRKTGVNGEALVNRFQTSRVKCWTVNFCIHASKSLDIVIYQLKSIYNRFTFTSHSHLFSDDSYKNKYRWEGIRIANTWPEVIIFWKSCPLNCNASVTIIPYLVIKAILKLPYITFVFHAWVIFDYQRHLVTLSSDFNQCTCNDFGIIGQLQCHIKIKNMYLICLKMLVVAIWIPVWIPIKYLRIWSIKSVWKNWSKTRNILDFTEFTTETGKIILKYYYGSRYFFFKNAFETVLFKGAHTSLLQLITRICQV